MGELYLFLEDRKSASHLNAVAEQESQFSLVGFPRLVRDQPEHVCTDIYRVHIYTQIYLLYRTYLHTENYRNIVTRYSSPRCHHIIARPPSNTDYGDNESSEGDIMKIFSSHYQAGSLHSSVTVIYHLHHTTPTAQDCHQHWRFSFIFGCESSPTSCHV